MTLDVANLVLMGLAHIENENIVTPIEASF